MYGGFNNMKKLVVFSGQFKPILSGHFEPKLGGQFAPKRVVNLNRNWVVNLTVFSKQFSNAMVSLYVASLWSSKA